VDLDGTLVQTEIDTRNLPGSAKADLLVTRFGQHGFDYLGNGRADLAIWSVAQARVAVSANARASPR
jgi:hypothetical protein